MWHQLQHSMSSLASFYLALGSCVLYALWAILNKVASRTLTAHEAQLYLLVTSITVVVCSARCILHVSFCLLRRMLHAAQCELIACTLQAALGGDKVRLASAPTSGVLAAVGAGTAGAVAGIMYSRALATGSTSMATAVSGLYPALACVLAAAFMGEPVQANQVIGVLLAVASGIAFASG
jgi:uncharacterized membrane protein